VLPKNRRAKQPIARDLLKLSRTRTTRPYFNLWNRFHCLKIDSSNPKEKRRASFIVRCEEIVMNVSGEADQSFPLRCVAEAGDVFEPEFNW